ncbi:MAG: metallophosphoesterase [Oscillospiraceae bacterium]|nr:metallophosphoesterase [Oscillospiraceae bacterium]
MKKKKYFISLCTAALLLLALIVWTVWGNTALMASTVTISSSRIPSAFSGFRIAQVSDLHNAEFGEDNAELLRILSENAPDLIAITGDLVDAGHTDLDIALDFVKEAAQIAPVYYVTGNHEASLPRYGELRAGIERNGAAVLEDEAVQFAHGGETIVLVGLSDPDFTLKGDLFGEASSMAGVKLKNLAGNGNRYTILLSHRPELFDSYADCGIDLVLSGHAHGGQFRLPLIGGLVAPNQGLFPHYDAGVYESGGTSMVVSRGLGNSIIPLRFNNRPEVVFIELRAE